MGNPSALAGFLLLLGVASSSPVSGQTPGLVNGAYERLSPGNQKIARALFDAQAAIAVAGPTGGARKLTLDEIAAQRRGGQAWGQVFHGMRARGLLHESNLGQVVSRYEHRGSLAVSSTAQKGKASSR
jgi:hypothetical protein